MKALPKTWAIHIILSVLLVSSLFAPLSCAWADDSQDEEGSDTSQLTQNESDTTSSTGSIQISYETVADGLSAQSAKVKTVVSKAKNSNDSSSDNASPGSSSTAVQTGDTHTILFAFLCFIISLTGAVAAFFASVKSKAANAKREVRL